MFHALLVENDSMLHGKSIQYLLKTDTLKSAVLLLYNPTEMHICSPKNMSIILIAALELNPN